MIKIFKTDSVNAFLHRRFEEKVNQEINRLKNSGWKIKETHTGMYEGCECFYIIVVFEENNQ